ncbi:MAG: hypothetical protein ACSHXK_07470 [Oceanococcus sp.]
MTGQVSAALRTASFVVAAACCLGALWWLLAPNTDVTAATNQVPPSVSFELDLTQQGDPEPQRLSATQGSPIEITLRVTKADTLHLHGYDLHQKLQAGTDNVVKFIANRSGRFDMELHDSDTHIAILEVYPKR